MRYNPNGRTWSANAYRHGHCYNIGTYYSQGDAVRAYEAEWRKENPNLAKVPERVERTIEFSDADNSDAPQTDGEE